MSVVGSLLERARMLAGAGNDDAAKQAYFEVLRLAPEHVAALVELGALAEASGHLSAARSAVGRAVQIDPQHFAAHTGLANTLRIGGDLPAAERHYRAALAAAPSFAPAHQGLAHTLFALGAPGAETHWRAGFGGQAVIRQRFRGKAPGIKLLLLIGGRGGDLHTNEWIDDRRFAVAAICAELFDPAHALPDHAIVVNAIGDADLCAAALAKAERLVENTAAPIINHPSSVRMTGRESNAKRLSAVPWVVAPRIETVRRGDAAVAREFGFPLLLRSPGYHTGHHFVRVDTSEALEAALASLPGDELMIIQYLDACGADGMARKYRVMFIDGAMYPLHLAVSHDWKVHYFSAAMADNAAFRQEESRFLDDMAEVLGSRAMAALAGIRDRLGLEYCGIDFALAPDGSVLLFEANATMVIIPPGQDAIWSYRRPAIGAALDAARAMIARRVIDPG